MAGPQVRGDIRVSRNVQTRKVRQGIRTFTPSSGEIEVKVAAGDGYSILLNTSAPARAVTVTLPTVSTATSEATATVGGTTNVPIGPGAGVGTEFRITNSTGMDAQIHNFGNVSVLTGGLPNGQTAIAFCTDATTTAGVWSVYIVDAASSSLTPRNVPFTEPVGTAASGSVTVTGTVTVVGVATLAFTNVGSASYNVSSTNLGIGTTAVQAVSALVTALNSDAGFTEFYVASADSGTPGQLNVNAVDNGTTYNSTLLDITVPAGLVGTDGTITGGAGGSWTLDESNANDPFFYFSIPRVRHQRGLDPIFSVYEQTAGEATRSEVLIDSTVNPTTGEIRILVNTVPEGRFAGSVDIL